MVNKTNSRKAANTKTLDSKKVHARYLYVYQGLNAKECAQKVMVTEKTMGVWVERYGWKEERESLYKRQTFADLENKALVNIIMGRLRAYLSRHYPELYDEIEESIEQFITQSHKEVK